MAVKVCFLGGARYGRPLDATSEPKFRAMSSLAELFVIGFSQDLRLRMFTEHARFYLLPALPLHVLRYLEIFVLGQILIFWLIVRHRVQVVVAQSPYEGFAAALALKCAGWLGYQMRLVVEVHGDFERSLFLYRRIRFRGLYRFLMNHVALYSFKQANLLRAISDSTKEQLLRWAPEKTIVQFPAWTDIDTFLQAGRTKKDVTQSVIYAGVLNPIKGIHHLINAFSLVAGQCPSAQLLIVGNDENKSYCATLMKQIKTLDLQVRVRILGVVPQSELALWMANSSVLVLPSLSEGLPRVIIEAMATGTPVIASRVGGIPELVEDGIRGFLIPPGDENSLSQKIRWVLENPDKGRAMGDCARTFAEQLFSTESYVKGYRQIFEMALPRFEPGEHAASSL